MGLLTGKSNGNIPNSREQGAVRKPSDSTALSSLLLKVPSSELSSMPARGGDSFMCLQGETARYPQSMSACSVLLDPLSTLQNHFSAIPGPAVETAEVHAKVYAASQESSQNIFLFASEGGCKEEDAKLKHSVDAIREQLLGTECLVPPSLLNAASIC